MPKRKLGYTEIKAQIDAILTEHGPREKLSAQRRHIRTLQKNGKMPPSILNRFTLPTNS